MRERATLRNFARGGKGFHVHRGEIIRGCLDPAADLDLALSPFLQEKLFKLDKRQFRVFSFGRKDWELSARLLATSDPFVEARLLTLVLYYLRANRESVEKIYAVSRSCSAWVMHQPSHPPHLEDGLLSALEEQSLFALRLKCALRGSDGEAMREDLNKLLVRGAWCQSRLMYPLLNRFASQGEQPVDTFLSYFLSGVEHEEEKLALKLFLDDTAAAEASLSFKVCRCVPTANRPPHEHHTRRRGH